MPTLFKKTGITLITLFVLAACSSSDDHLDVAGFDVFMDNEVVVSQRGTTVTGSFNVQAGSSTPEMRVVFLDSDNAVLTITSKDEYLEVISSNTTVLGVTKTGDWTFTLQGVSQGTANLTLGIMHGSHFDFESRLIPVTVQQPAQ
jgi:uncharacterized protein YcfL